MIFVVAIGAFYLGGVAAVLPILTETQPLSTALRLAACWPLHPWEVG